jgi:methionine sulfoxide reductase catalytic subunit
MILKVKTLADVPSSEITPEHVYRSRREFMQATAAGAVGVVAGSLLGGGTGRLDAAQQDLAAAKKAAVTVDPKVDPLNTFDQVTSYNNYYEFGTRKDDPMRNAGRLTVKPWTVKVDGLVNKPGDYGVEDLVDFNQLEERVYRLRCVEAWSMVIPWIGVPLSAVLNKVQPQPSAKFVEFTTLVRPSEMPGLRTANLEWPYVEGLRMDEAMHPLTLVVVGLYGKVLPNQNGAPLRVHSPWKYGFKGGKSIVRIRFMANQPNNTWAVQTPHEYGFYANVNPNVDHPRWSQKREKRLPTLFANRQTLMFNGYADQVASLYAGMDLTKYY